MRKSDHNVMSAVESCIDIFLNVIAIVAAYMSVLVFQEPLIYINSFQSLFGILIILLVSVFIYQVTDMYATIPRIGKYRFVKVVLKSNVILFGGGSLVLILIGGRELREFLIFWCAFSAFYSTAILIFKKRVILSVIKALRKRDFNVRRVIIVGDNVESANAFARQVVENSDSGMIILGGVGRKMSKSTACDYLGTFEDLERVLDTYRPSDVVFAIDAYNKRNIINLVNLCDDRCVKVYFLPVIYGFFKSARQIEGVGNIPIINVHANPLDNKLNAAMKRALDIVGSLFLIILSSPIMLAIAIGVRATSDGPVIFRQERVGIMGKRFEMLKFRSMYVTKDANQTWTTNDDGRKTRFGAFLRRSSLDELPQLFNVLRGDMSLVGPRPEVPHFVEYFKDQIPLYMVKHYVKPGMTGLAQVNGLRGDTSVEDRIQADISYIENWSFFGDISILLKTPFKAFNDNEKYKNSEINDDTDADIEFDFSTMRASSLPSASECGKFEAVRGKKILYAASTMSHIGNFHTDYINALKADGCDVKVMASGEGADFNIPFEKRFISVRNLLCRRRIAKILKEEEFDTLVLNTSLAAYHIRRVCKKKKRPHVVNFVHGYLFSENVNRIKAFLMYICEKLLSKKTDDIIVMNLQDYRTAVRKHLCRQKVYFVKGMGAEVREVMTNPEELRRRYECDDKYVLSFVGELSERKNQEFLIRALPKIIQNIPNAVLWLVGSGAYRPRLEELAQELSVSERVMFMGQRADACDYIRASDLYVSASSGEGMPFNLIEALGCGTTVLVSDIKGHVDLVENSVDGMLFGYNNTEDFITKVYKIYSKAISIPMENKISKYEKYTKSRVFPDTLSVLMRTISD